MIFAYADPPYPGCGHLYPEGADVDHVMLFSRLERDFPDGWALSTSSVALRDVLAASPEGTRVAAWVKPFGAFKPNVNPAYVWEPVLFHGGRKRGREELTVRDWVSANITMKTGVVGAKPVQFCYWIFDLLGARPQDEMVDLFPGGGAVTDAWEDFKKQYTFAVTG